mmetsp:Transcript_77085/g.121284  ORF Transcript_77085/g.121284 Transcript_77085/m.121284 type:complete len:165 (+) Transcript_77085:30-524(+)
MEIEVSISHIVTGHALSTLNEKHNLCIEGVGADIDGVAVFADKAQSRLCAREFLELSPTNSTSSGIETSRRNMPKKFGEICIRIVAYLRAAESILEQTRELFEFETYPNRISDASPMGQNHAHCEMYGRPKSCFVVVCSTPRLSHAGAGCQKCGLLTDLLEYQA